MNKEKIDRFIKRFDHFCSCIDFSKSTLDNEAIVFMNDVFNKTVFKENK